MPEVCDTSVKLPVIRHTAFEYIYRYIVCHAYGLNFNIAAVHLTNVRLQVSKSDAGQYECSVIDRYTNEVQQAAYTYLNVVVPPRITLRPKTQTVLPGSSPSVECVVEGDDIIDVSWRPLDKPSSR